MLANTGVAEQSQQAVLRTIETLMSERGLETSVLREDAKLVDTLGLKSMDIAEIVLLLEDELEVDPFQEIPITSVRTVGDLIRAYRTTLDPASAKPADGEPEVAQPATGVSRRSGRRR